MIPFFSDSTQSPLLSGDIPRVKQTLVETLGQAPTAVQESVRSLLEANGKMLRPAFVTLSARFGDFEAEKAYTLAASVEMLHMATLIHDDVIDESAFRRGKPAVHTVFGKRHAVLLGDFLFGRCFLTATDFITPGKERSILNAVSRICESELEQGNALYNPDSSVRKYLRRIAGKTAALFAISCYAGGTASGCPGETTAILRRIGYCVGMGFQIIDDILDFTSEQTTLGKPVGGDLKAGIFTLPIIFALKTSENTTVVDGTSAGGTLLQELRKHPYSKRRLSKIIQQVYSLGGIEKAREIASGYTDRALRDAERLPDIPAKNELIGLITRLLDRTY
jgi:heptaprenyl diphosphate synthase